MSKIIDYDLQARKKLQNGVDISESAGDGTTITTLLAQKLIDAGTKKVEAGINPIDLNRGIDKASENCNRRVKKMAVRVNTDSTKIEQVAAISAGNNTEIGN